MGRYYSPPQLARAWGIDSHKILTWIASGELVAANLAAKPGGRPRYRISQEAIEAFEIRRSVQPATKITRRKRRHDDNIIEFYK